MSEATPINFFQRLRLARLWVFLQFTLTLVLIVAALAWTRLPDKHGWQVVLTLLVPLLLLLCVLELEAATIRKLADDDGRRVNLLAGALSLLPWIAIGAAAWALLNWGDDQIPLWSGYLNSKPPAHARATILTYDHIQRWLTELEWVLRWIVLPAKLIPLAAASALWGWRLPWRRIIRLLWNWRWWLGVILAAIAGVWLPGHFFDKLPSGTVSAQVWHVGLKLAGAYLLAVASWILILAWWATLFATKKHPTDEEVLVAVPVLAGPPRDHRSAKAEIPPTDLDSEA
ncbi:MAG: hypothetical protein ABSF53_27865 [Terracidiphilus sp.]